MEISLEGGMKGISVRPWSSQFVFMLRGFVRFETPPPSNSTCVRLGGGGSAVQRRNGGSLEVRGRISPRNMVRPLRIFSEEGEKHRSAALKSKRCLFPPFGRAETIDRPWRATVGIGLKNEPLFTPPPSARSHALRPLLPIRNANWVGGGRRREGRKEMDEETFPLPDGGKQLGVRSR